MYRYHIHLRHHRDGGHSYIHHVHGHNVNGPHGHGRDVHDRGHGHDGGDGDDGDDVLLPSLPHPYHKPEPNLLIRQYLQMYNCLYLGCHLLQPYRKLFQ